MRSNIATSQIKKSMIEKIIEILFEIPNVHIYGGAVRDLLISKNLTKRFNKKINVNKELFVDPNFDSDTKDRLIVPIDIDVYISNVTNKDIILEEITNKFLLNFFEFKYESITRTEYGNIPSTCELYKGNIKPIFNKLLQSSLTLDIKDLTVSIDLLLDLTYTEPPFSKPDFECNTLFRTNESVQLSTCHYGIFSSNSERLRKTAKIKKNIINKITKVYPVILDIKIILANTIVPHGAATESTFTIEYLPQIKTILNRIFKMLDRDWNFINFPIKIKPDGTYHCNNNDCVISKKDTLTALKKSLYTIKKITHQSLLPQELIINHSNQEIKLFDLKYKKN